MEPIPGVAVTLVCDTPVVPYSAMVPGHISGEYRRDEMTIDLVRLCAASGVRLIAEAATGFDAKKRVVTFADRPPISWDVASLGLGSFPALPEGVKDGDVHWIMRPLGRTIDRIDALDRSLKEKPRPFHLVIAGGGASGCELAMGIRKRFKGTPDFKLSIVQGNERLIPTFAAKASKVLEATLKGAGIDVHLKARITSGDDHSIGLENGVRLTCDAVLWATSAASPPLVRASGLPVDKGGFLLVKDTLQSTAHASVFGTGDSIAFESNPGLAKNGVYAVREGGVLFRNIRSFLREGPLETFKPQRFCRNILNTCDGEAIYTYFPFTIWKSAGARKLKERIDREWMEKFSVFPRMEAAADESTAMRCGGCGSKISADVLTPVLKSLDVGDDPRILLGAKAGEDAAVHRMKPELFGKDPSKLVEVQTVDFFKAFIDDPFVFGQVAAVHAVSDIFAMNARPFTALATVTLPYARGPVLESTLRELLTGAVKSLRSMGVTLTGGHTVEGPELALGLTVTGHGEEGNLFLKGALKPGDALVLTKPIGTGALLAAWMRSDCKAAWLEPLLKGMTQDNGAAAAVLARHGVRAVTDVTGFGLGGHLLEMLDASKAGARLEGGRVPLYAGFTDVVAKGILSTLHRDNEKAAGRVKGAKQPPAWLFDPQTSGGLLAGIEGKKAFELVKDLVAAGYPETAIIGEVSAGDVHIEVN